jgi:hypothetical protein
VMECSFGDWMEVLSICLFFVLDWYLLVVVRESNRFTDHLS